MGNARLDLRGSRGPVIVVGPRGPARLARLVGAPAPRGLRGLRGLAAFWGAVLAGTALVAVTLQLLGPPERPVAQPAGAGPTAAAPAAPDAPALSAPAPYAPAPYAPALGTPPLADAAPQAAAPGPAPSQRLAPGAFVAIPMPERIPVPPLSSATPRHPAPDIGAPAAAATQAPLSAAPALAGAPSAPVRRAVIHYRAGAADGDAERLADRARALAGRVELRAVGATPSRPSIRYFFDEDARAAETLAAGLAGAGLGAFQVRGFPNYRPSPSPGTIEVWLP